MITWFKNIPWDAIGKYGLGTVLAVVFAGGGMYLVNRLLNQADKANEVHLKVATSQQSLADAVDDLSQKLDDKITTLDGSIQRFATEADDIGDEMRIMNTDHGGKIKDLCDACRRVLEKVWGEHRQAMEAQP